VTGILTFFLVESALELVPERIRAHGSVKAWCRRFGRRPGEAVLDVNYMRDAMKGIPDAGRRGRPDIVHYFLLNVMEGPAGRKGLVDVYIHTYGGSTFYVEPGTRIPRSYARFIGIMAQVLRGVDTPRIHPVSRTPQEIIRAKKKEGYRVVGMDVKGERVLPENVLGRDSVVVIGGFQKGEIRGDYCVEKWVSLGGETYPTWVIGAEVVAGWERKFLFPG